MENKKKRILMSTLGVILCGVSVGFVKRAAFGVDPFQVLVGGIDALVPIHFGTLYVICNLVLLLFSLFADRHYIGLATMINLFLLGYVVEYSHGFLMNQFPNMQIGGRMLCLLIGIVMICFSSAFYFVADLGVSTYDAVALIITETWKKGKFRYVRISTDLVCVLLGAAMLLISGASMTELMAMVGAGTIITAFFMGPLIEVFRKYVAEPFLYGKDKK